MVRGSLDGPRLFGGLRRVGFAARTVRTHRNDHAAGPRRGYGSRTSLRDPHPGHGRLLYRLSPSSAGRRRGGSPAGVHRTDDVRRRGPDRTGPADIRRSGGPRFVPQSVKKPGRRPELPVQEAVRRVRPYVFTPVGAISDRGDFCLRRRLCRASPFFVALFVACPFFRVPSRFLRPAFRFFPVFCAWFSSSLPVPVSGFRASFRFSASGFCAWRVPYPGSCVRLLASFLVFGFSVFLLRPFPECESCPPRDGFPYLLLRALPKCKKESLLDSLSPVTPTGLKPVTF